MDVRELLDDLLAEIAAEENALEQKRALASLLKRRLDGGGSTESVAGANVSRYGLGPSSVTSRRIAPAPRLSIAGMLSRVVDQFHDVVFDVNAVDEQLRRRYGVAANKTVLSTSLARLVERGVIEKVSEGSGSVPNTYRALVGTGQNDADEELERQAGGKNEGNVLE